MSCGAKAHPTLNFAASACSLVNALILRWLALLASLALAACASSPAGNSVSRAGTNSACPPSIVAIAGPTQWDTSRYGGSANYDTMLQLRDREIAACRSEVAAGSLPALRSLEGHWRREQNLSQLVSTYQSYLDSTGDSRVKRQLALDMYALYKDGEPGFRPNAIEAQRYLGLAVNYGATELRPDYARLLALQGQNAEAQRQYKTLVDQGAGTREARCENQLQLGYLYFLGQGATQNANLGYFYWQRGLEQAAGARWGSCISDNFGDQKRYRYETDRKQFVDAQLKQVSIATQSAIREAARMSPETGAARVAALPLPRPSQPTASVTSTANIAAAAPASRPASNTYTNGWPAWSPLRGGICAMAHSNTAVSRASLYSTAAPALWTLLSGDAKATVIGSAVAVTPSLLLSNCHVLSEPTGISLQNSTGKRSARVIAADLDGDRCILMSEQPSTAYLQRGRSISRVQIGEDVSAVGSPKGMSNTLSVGIVAGKRERSGLSLLQTDAALSNGSSGGGLFDNRANLIGITTFRIPDANSLNFAIAIDEFCE